MPADELSESDWSRWVAGAAHHTMESGSARVRECSFSEPPPRSPERDFTTVAHGVADLTNRRVRLQSGLSPGWERLGELIARRFPWLDDEDGETEDDEDETLTVHAGTAMFIGHGDRWMAASEKDADPRAGRRAPKDPLWILEVLATAAMTVDPVAPGERQPVRGASCRRLRFRADMRSSAGRLEGAQLPHTSRNVSGDVWIDDHNRIRRVTWRRPTTRRPRALLEPPRVTFWRTVELWDFGTVVDIDIPTPSPIPDASLRETLGALRALWRRKRTYERESST